MENENLIRDNARDKEKLHTLIDLIIMNTKFNWNNEITIDNDKSIIDYLKIIAYEKVQDRYDKLDANKFLENLEKQDGEHIPNLQ